MRPHPTENIQLWKDNVMSKNIYFDDHLYPSHYYVLSALNTIQYGSTIAYESYAMEKICTEFSSKEAKNLKRFELQDHKKIIFEFNDKEKLLRHLKLLINSKKKEKEFFIKKEKIFKLLKNNLGSSSRIIEEFNKFDDVKKTYPIKFDFSFYISKIFFKRILLWLYAILKIYKIIPKNLLKGKFVILGEKYAINHSKHFEYKKKKQAYIPDEIINFVKDLCNRNMKKKFYLLRIYRNNFLVD